MVYQGQCGNICTEASQVVDTREWRPPLRSGWAVYSFTVAALRR